MCTNKRWIINKYTGDKVLVSCGSCPSCLQEKACKVATNIRRHGKEGELCLFCTFTYTNDFVPFIDKNDRLYFFWRDGKLLPHLAIWRNADVVRSYNRHNKRYNERIEYRRHIVDFLPCVDVDCSEMKYNHKFVENNQYIPITDLCYYGDNRFSVVSDICSSLTQKLPFLQDKYGNVPFDFVGVSYYRDIQNFVKRLYQFLKRVFNYDTSKLSMFLCSEYGSDKKRPHFHALFWFPSQDYKLAKLAITSCWSYCNDYQRRYKLCEVAKSPSRYVASYLSKSVGLPSFFETKWFKPRHSTSRNFNTSNKNFQFETIKKCFLNRDLRVSWDITREGGKLERVTLPLPRYVISKFFPKCSGFGRLTYSEVLQCCTVPTRFRELFERNENYLQERYLLLINKASHPNIKDSDLQFMFYKYEKFFIRLRKIAYGLGMSIHDYLIMHKDIWTLWYSQRLKILHDSVHSVSEYFTGFYDNILDFFTGSVRCDFLDGLMFECTCFILDPNKFPRNIADTAYYSGLYHRLNHQKMVSDFFLSDNSL